MQLQKITWEYLGKPGCLWEGKLDGLYCHLRFFIIPLGRDDEYYLRNDLKEIPNEIVKGIEPAKTRTQALFVNYVWSMTI